MKREHKIAIGVVLLLLTILVLAVYFMTRSVNSLPSEKDEETTLFTWYPHAWIDGANTPQMKVSGRPECEARCSIDPNCMAYTFNANANVCYGYDHVQPNTPNGIRTDEATTAPTSPWGAGIRQ